MLRLKANGLRQLSTLGEPANHATLARRPFAAIIKSSDHAVGRSERSTLPPTRPFAAIVRHVWRKSTYGKRGASGSFQSFDRGFRRIKACGAVYTLYILKRRTPIVWSNDQSKRQLTGIDRTTRFDLRTFARLLGARAEVQSTFFGSV